MLAPATELLRLCQLLQLFSFPTTCLGSMFLGLPNEFFTTCPFAFQLPKHDCFSSSLVFVLVGFSIFIIIKCTYHKTCHSNNFNCTVQVINPLCHCVTTTTHLQCFFPSGNYDSNNSPFLLPYNLRHRCSVSPNLTAPGTRGASGKESTWNAGKADSVSGSGTAPGVGNGKPLQYSCLENSMDRGAWWATVHGVAKSHTRLSN